MATLPPLAPSRIRLVWCLRNPFWRPYEDNNATWDSGDWYHMSRLHADLTSERPYPKRGAWVARRSSADDAWDVTHSSRRPSMVAQPDAVMHAALALMAGMDKAHEVEWIGRGGQGVQPGDLRTYEGVTYRALQSPGINIWPPPTVPAIWEAL